MSTNSSVYTVVKINKSIIVLAKLFPYFLHFSIHAYITKQASEAHESQQPE